MTLETIGRAKLAQALQLVDGSGEICENAIANLLRTPLMRWGLSAQRTIHKYARDQLKAAGLKDVSRIPQVLDRMIAIGDCDRVYVGQGVYLAPAEPRWVSVGNAAGVYLGVSGPPKGITTPPRADHGDIVQRISVASDDDAATLQLAGVREVAFADWLHPLDYLQHASRRLRSPARSDTVTLPGFWELLEGKLAEEGWPLSADADVRALTGEPGSFFGRYDQEEPEGRWTAVVPNGVWLGVRRGYGEKHWHPVIIAVDGEERHTLDLYDFDEWRWALIARGKNTQADEVVNTSGNDVQLTFPAPNQLRTTMDLLGPSTAPWSWELLPGAPDVMALLE